MTTIALVTGANKGIGQQIVDQLARLGMTVLLGARDPERGAGAVAALRDSGDVRPLAIDVTDDDSVRAAAGQVADQFGRLDVLVNNAGITGGPDQRPASADLATLRAAYEVNVFGVVRVTNAMLPLLSTSDSPRIVNVSSSVGSFGVMTAADGPVAGMPGSAAYVPSKAALNMLTVQYAKDLKAAGVLVNAACPGYCATDLNNHQGYRTPAQGAAIAVRLATLPDGGPTGGFFDDAGPVAW
jgi:NAD(P)-dependent dehydrogenase (short-subunit alcohol dehydrogenase family)